MFFCGFFWLLLLFFPPHVGPETCIPEDFKLISATLKEKLV